MSDGVALRAGRGGLGAARAGLGYAIVLTALGIWFVAVNLRELGANGDESSSFAGVSLAALGALVAWMWWELAKATRIVPMVTIVIDGSDVRFVRPLIRTSGTSGRFRTLSPIVLMHAVVQPRRGVRWHSYTASQGDASVRFMGWAPVGDDALRAARDQLLGSGVDLNIDSALESGDAAAWAPARLRSTLESRGALCVEPAPGAPVEAEFAVSGGELTYAALGSDHRGDGVRWLTDDDVSGEVRGFSIGAVTTVHLTVTFDDVAPSFRRKDRRDLPGLTDHLVFVDDVHDDPCHVLPSVPVKAYEVLADPADASHYVLRLVAGASPNVAT